ncbi:MAG: cellulose-binding protein, partial [Actinomycetales bacterium]|nr:cellulose-binding protein [Actinomycetales bacterium]
MRYSVVNQWTGGFQGTVAVTNTGDAWSTWTLTFRFADGQTVTQGWNGRWSQSASTVTVANESWNGNVATGASVAPGFIGSWNGANNAPTGFAVNGVTCGGQTTTTTTRTTPTTTTTTTTRTTPTTTTSTTTRTTPTTTTSGLADITVDPGTRYQTVDGFGAALPIWPGSASGMLTTSEVRTMVGMGDNELGLSILRTMLSHDSNTWSYAVANLKEAESYGSNVKFLASPWTAPAAWKTNNSLTG